MRNMLIGFFILIFISFIAALIIIFLSSKKPFVKLEEQVLENAIIEDAKKRFQGADIVDIVKITKRDENEVVLVRLTYNYSSICPKRHHVYYSYPSGRFLPEYPVEVITNCDFCKNGSCFIAYEEEAIIASVNIKGSEKIRDFVISQKAYPVVKKLDKNYWQVSWISNDKKAVVVISKNGELISSKID